MRSLKDKNLRILFHNLNQRYFDGKLDKPNDVRFKKMKASGKCVFNKNKVKIFIHEDLKKHPDFTAITMLHEMAHLKLGPIEGPGGDEHGFQFGHEICRLWESGAYDSLL